MARNIGEALLGGLSQGLGFAGQNLLPQLQQQRNNKRQDLLDTSNLESTDLLNKLRQQQLSNAEATGKHNEFTQGLDRMKVEDPQAWNLLQQLSQPPLSQFEQDTQRLKTEGAEADLAQPDN